jgi:methionine-rich copper-binding protein CopC
MLSIRHVVTRAGVAAFLGLAGSVGSVSAHSYPQSMNPAANARLDAAPAHVGITYDSNILQSGTSLALLDQTGAPVPVQADATSGRQSSVQPRTDLAPGPYTVAWTSVSADDGHQAQGFYTFVVNGGPVGIIDGQAQSQAPAADLMTTLTVSSAADGASLLRADLNNTAGVERVRIQLSRPDLGVDLLDTQPSGDGGWILNGNEVAIPGAWHAQVIVRRTNVVDDAKGDFDFTVDNTTGAPAFGTASTLTLASVGGFARPLVFQHAQYAGSTPAAGSTLPAAPGVVQVTFSQELSDIHISITGPHGGEVTTAPAKFDLENRHQSSVPMSDDGPGTYTVLWHNVSGDDGDPNDGQFVFTVAAAAATPVVTTTATPAVQPAAAAAQPTPAPAPAPACVDNGVRTPGINDSRVDTYCKREAIRQKYAGQIDVASFNAALADGEGLESALSDAIADFQGEQAQKKH